MTKNQARARIERAERHAEQDQLIAGTYGELIEGEFYGCSVGCDAWEIKSNQSDGSVPKMRDYMDLNHHQVVADHDGTAYWFELLRDRIFEGMLKDRRSWWHIESAKALATLPEDVDWDHLRTAVWVKVLRFALEQQYWDEKVSAAIESAIDYISSPSEDLRSAVALRENLTRASGREASISENPMRDWRMVRAVSHSPLSFALVKLVDGDLDRALSTVAGAVGEVGSQGDRSYRILADRIIETIKTQAN
jgi:hypothetical protein